VVTDQRPKVFRALNIEPPKEGPQKRPDSDLARLQSAIAEQFASIVAHDPGTRLGTDPEDLHQHRVGIRRLRSLLWAAKGLLEPEWTNKLRAELEWIGDQMNPVRDLDVMIPYLRADLDELEPDESAELEPFIKSLEAERDKARATMLAALETDRYLDLLNVLEGATRSISVQPQVTTLKDGAVKAFKRMRKAAKQMQEPLEDEAMHLVRRLAKKSRYSAEVVRGGGKAVASFLSTIKGLQDVLGDHQDAVVAEQRIKDYLSEVAGIKAAFALGRMAERQASKKRACQKAFPEAWRAVKRVGRKAWL
jgi:CHAD domain-containing protein